MGAWPRLLLDGKPCSCQPYLRSWEKYPGREHVPFADLCADYRQQYALGCRLFLFQATCASDFYVSEVEIWRSPEVWDWTQLDAFLDFFSRECPEAVLVPLVYIGAPTWWEDAHHEELLRFADGTCEATFSAASASGRRKVASLASESWATAMDDGLRRLVRHCRPYGNRIGGYILGSGITYEWGLLGSFDFIDYSAPAQRWWNAWRAARGLSPAALPSPEQRLAGTDGWRHPQAQAVVIEHQRSLSDLVADRIVRFAKVVKTEAPNTLTAVYYGYTLTARAGRGFVGRYGAGGFQGGHHALRTVLDSPHIDLITSPWSYANRRLGTGDLTCHYPWDSVRLAGKVSWPQDDNSTFLTYKAEGIDIGWEPDLSGSILQMRRAAARYMASVDNVYRMDLIGGNFNHPELLAEITQLTKAAARVEEVRRPADAEVLVIVDEDAVAYLDLGSDLHLANVYRQIPQLSRMGCPYHIVLASDAERLDPSVYKFLILCLCPRRDARLDNLLSRFRSSGASVLSLPFTAMVGENGADEAGALVCQGIIKAIPNDDGLIVCKRDTGGFDASATVAPVPSRALAALAARAGCHLVHEGGELLWATPNITALHVDKEGTYRLCPRGGVSQVTAVLTSGPWWIDENAIVCVLHRHETVVFAHGKAVNESM